MRVHLDHIVRHPFMRHLENFRAKPAVGYLKEQIDKSQRYGLCPVTKRIATRYKQWKEA